MAKIFLDANFFIDLIEQRKKINFNQFKSHSLFLSVLTLHIYIYLYKIKIPDKNLEKLLSFFNIIPLEEKIFYSSLKGPFSDFEDNIQLHSSSLAECDVYLTNDKKILKLKFFGKTKIISSLEEI
ncbi:MAG: hypothetical protein NZM02_01670 [Patescibacteria group bacterium]|nr:hypothetical protein [Patescibacteria group bacterium]